MVPCEQSQWVGSGVGVWLAPVVVWHMHHRPTRGRSRPWGSSTGSWMAPQEGGWGRWCRHSDLTVTHPQISFRGARLRGVGSSQQVRANDLQRGE
jgi:hypothetical protein